MVDAAGNAIDSFNDYKNDKQEAGEGYVMDGQILDCAKVREYTIQRSPHNSQAKHFTLLAPRAVGGEQDEVHGRVGQGQDWAVGRSWRDI